MIRRHSYCIFAVVIIGLSGCKPEEFTYEDNPVPPYDEISTILVQNYINRMYIDLIGREPTDAEMERDVSILEGDSLSPEIRIQVIQNLVLNTDTIDGLTYRGQYHQKLYTDLKARFLEGASDAILYERYGVLRSSAINDSINGNWVSYSINQAAAERLLDVLDCPEQLESGEIDVREACTRMIWNAIYDQINMNSFNFVNATFDDLYQRFPTQAEFDVSYNIVEYNQPNLIFGMSASDKESYIEALLWNPEWKEGMVRWQFRSMLARDPSDAEILEGLIQFDMNLWTSDIQTYILQSDEYAGF
ncbi:MAG: hypothetical protein O2818_06570 [Bacteroidetes bacterium]|nr:hypothetical protein [Bacteroidota bacterium]